MRPPPRSGVLGSALFALLAADLAARLLAPPDDAIEPSEVAVEEYFSDEEIRRGSRFARPQRALALARAAVELAALGAVVRRRPWRALERIEPPAAGGAAAAAALTAAMALPPLPLAALARRRAIAVGLVTQSWPGWAVDLVKSTAIGSVLAGGAGGAVVAAMRRYPRTWWLPAGAGSVVAGAALAALAPVLLDPLFNDFEPLPESQTRADVLELARRAEVQVGEVYSVDASRRTSAANAYVTGLGPTKRVVLFDTLLDRYSRDELRVVVAHELAHVRHRDVRRSLLYAACVAPGTAWAVQQLSWALSDERGTPGALPALALAAAVIGAPVGVVGNRLSRAVERRADSYSLALSAAPEAFISFERAISLQNVADLKPPAWVTRLLATHPSTVQRIGAAVSYANQGARSAPP